MDQTGSRPASKSMDLSSTLEAHMVLEAHGPRPTIDVGLETQAATCYRLAPESRTLYCWDRDVQYPVCADTGSGN